AARHVDIEQHDVGLELGDRAHRVLDGLGFAEDLDQASELRLDPASEDPVVVDDDDRGCAHRRPLMLSSTSVPSPGSLRTSALPPYLAIRRIIDSRTPRRSSGIESRSKPGPRSSMNTRAPPL